MKKIEINMVQCTYSSTQKKILVSVCFLNMIFICVPILYWFYTLIGAVSISKYFPPIEENHAEKIAINREDICVDVDDLVKGLCPGLQLDVYHIGFPSLYLIPITVS